MWEFDPAEHQMLLELFDTMLDLRNLEGAVQDRRSSSPPFEDRGLSAKRLASPVSPLTITRCSFSTFGGRFLSHHADQTGMGGDGGVD